MKQFIALIFTGLLFHSTASAQDSENLQDSPDSLIRELAKMKTNTLDCSADTFWKLVSKGKESVPYLLNSLTDTTPTTVYHVCKSVNLTIGDLCYLALEEIADFPAFAVTQIQFCTIEMMDDGTSCPSYYDYIFNNENKATYQEKARVFYEKATYRFVKYSKS